MARRAVYSITEKLDQLTAAGYTQGEIAESIGISTRQLRRWRNKAVQPSAASAAAVSQLSREATKARQALRRQAERQGVRLPKRLTVAPPVRRLQRRIETPTGVIYKPGAIVELDTEGMSTRGIFDLLWPYREQALQRGRRARREPGSFRFVLRELGKRKPLKAGTGRGGPRHSTYVTRLMREKEFVQHRKPKKERTPVQAVYMSRPIGWTAVLTDEELGDIIAQARAGNLGGGGWQSDIIAVRIYPPGL